MLSAGMRTVRAGASLRRCLSTGQAEATLASVADRRVGWVGTGIMGASMCKHLLQQGAKEVRVFNRTAAKAQPLQEEAEARGSQLTLCSTPAEVAKDSDVVFTIVGFPKDVRSIYLEGGGILEGARGAPGKVLVDMTTSQPSLAVQIATAAEADGHRAVDAPVSGGDIGARNGTLTFMIGGNAEAVQELEPYWKAMGSKWERMGEAGRGQHTKCVNQILIASGMLGLVEGLLYAEKAGLNKEKIIELLGGGAAGSWSLANYGPRIVKGDFQPGFCVEHFRKDLGIALEEAAAMDLHYLPGLSAADQLYRVLCSQDGARLGTQALYLCYKKINAF